MVTPRQFPFDDIERDLVVSALEVAGAISKQFGLLVAVAKYDELKREIAGADRADGLQALVTPIDPAAKVVDLDQFRKVNISVDAEHFPPPTSARDTVEGWREGLKGAQCPATLDRHKLVAVDRHGDELICENCGALEEEIVT
tara:strand:- start:152 stop:580 length:429 start_codon:yes stop_codon:yes gene_type:complete